ncbi:MAG: AzlD domain-containing protein [Desulfovibrio sp.]|nr:AzlD domain-containing protein [Desulfovibrio sp.]
MFESIVQTLTDGRTQQLLLCLLGCILVTVGPKILPITFLESSALPPIFRRWLDFVPVAVMAALVGSEIFFYDGVFNLSTTNLFLMVSIPSFVVALISKNYFLPIAVGIGLLILARHYGLT